MQTVDFFYDKKPNSPKKIAFAAKGIQFNPQGVIVSNGARVQLVSQQVVVDAVIDAYTYDYINYRKSLNETAAKWFTEQGQKNFMRSLDTSGNLDQVIKDRLILYTMATKVPQLEESGRIGTQHYWVVIVPIVIEFYAGGASDPRTRQHFLANVTIVQTPASATNLKGIAVNSISLSPYIPNKR